MEPLDRIGAPYTGAPLGRFGPGERSTSIEPDGRGTPSDAAEVLSTMAQITAVTNESDRTVIRRLFAEYQRSTERLLSGTDISP